MAQSVEDLLVRIDASTESLRRELRRADQSINRFDQNVGSRLQRIDQRFQRLNQRMRRLSQGAQGLAAAFAGVQLARFGGQALNSAEQIDRMAESLNISRERVQELQFTFARFGLQQKDVNDALSTLADRAQDAIDGTESIREDFDAIGISVDQLRGKSPAKLFDLVARAIANTEDPTKRAAAAVRILEDEMGQRLLPLLRQGPEALDRFARQARRAGTVMSDNLVRRSAEAAAQFDQLRLSIARGFERGFLQGISSEFDNLDDSIVQTGRAARRFGEMLGDGASRAADAMEVLSENADIAVRGLQTLVGLRIGAAFGPWGAAIGAVAGLLGDELVWAANKAYDALNSLKSMAVEAIEAVDSALAATGRAIAKQMERQIDRQDQAARRFFRINAELFNPAVQQNGQLYGNLLIGGAEAADQMGLGRRRSGNDLPGGADSRARLNETLEFSRMVFAGQQATGDRAGTSPAPGGDGGGSGLPSATNPPPAPGFKPEDAIAQSRRAEKLAQQLRADLNPALTRYNDRLENIRLASPWLSQQEQAELTRQALNRLRQETGQYEAELRFVEQAADRAFDRIGGSITDAMVRGEDAMLSLQNVAQGVLSEIMQSFIQLAAINPLKNALGIGGGGLPTLAGVFQSGALSGNPGTLFGAGGALGTSVGGTFGGVPAGVTPALADGGSFDVGAGFPQVDAGRDNRLVSFFARDGERVNVQTPQQQKGNVGGGVNVHQTINVSANGDKQVAQIARQAAAQGIQEAAPAIVSQSVQQTGERMRRNPKFGRRA